MSENLDLLQSQISKLFDKTEGIPAVISQLKDVKANFKEHKDADIILHAEILKMASGCSESEHIKDQNGLITDLKEDTNQIKTSLKIWTIILSLLLSGILGLAFFVIRKFIS